MERNEFYDVVLSLGKDYFSKNLLSNGKLKLHHQDKNNDTVCCGIMVENYDNSPSPVLYLEEFYDEYVQGNSMDSIMKSIAEVYEEAWRERPGKNQYDFDFESVKEQLIFKVINVSKNRKRLETLGYKLLGNDLAMIFAVKVNEDATVEITKNFIREFNYDLEEVYKNALKNTPKFYPAFFRDMLDYLVEGSILGDKNEKEGLLYILTNTEKFYGAGVAFYPEVLEMVANKLGGSFFAIPSSVHEWLVFSEDENIKDKNYHEMIKEINENMVHCTEVLSDYLFRYDKVTKEFYALINR